MARVLIVEDEPDSRDLVRMTLEMAGHSVLEAGTAEEGVEMARESRPDIVLMDLGLPGPMRGLDAVRMLREDETFDRTPILAVTAYAMRGDRERAIVSGCDEYLTKPLTNLREFAELVGRYAAGGRTPAPGGGV